MLIYSKFIACVYIFIAPRTNNGVAKVILAFHRHSLGVKDTVSQLLTTLKSSNAYAYSFVGYGAGLQQLLMINEAVFYAFAGLRIGNAQVHN